jgi:hypothetical protein
MQVALTCVQMASRPSPKGAKQDSDVLLEKYVCYSMSVSAILWLKVCSLSIHTTASSYGWIGVVVL